jgi:hypothetical protein
MTRRLFALDHNFPEPVLLGLAKAIPMAELVPIRAIRSELSELDDWELLLALHRDERPWDGLVTNDVNMLSLPREMTVLSQTALTLVAVRGEGHNPVRSIGALLCHLPFICFHTVRDRAQIWRLGVAQKNYEEVADYLEKIAARQGSTVQALVEQHKVSKAELTTNPPSRRKR